MEFRDRIYDIFIYQLNVNECIWYIFKQLLEKKLINEENISSILIKINTFFFNYFCTRKFFIFFPFGTGIEYSNKKLIKF